SRSACPMLNVMANYDVLPHDGKNITFKNLSRTVRETFNFALSFCFFVPKFSEDLLRSHWKDKFDLEELSLHNIIEIRFFPPYLSAFFVAGPQGSYRKSKRWLIAADDPKYLASAAKRRVDARKINPAYTKSFFHNVFGSAKDNSLTMLTIFGGRINDLKPMLTEERFSERWEARVRAKYGLTMAKFNGTVFNVEKGVKKL
ncbi:hypothetical protein BJ878DRAFT_389062, partial [Calycina marina]